MEVTDKIIAVTGGGGGIGEALCRRFSQEGAKAVVVADINEKAAKAVAADIKGAGVACDVSREEDIIRLVRFTEGTFGPIDFFCSNAGILIMGDVLVPNENWQRIWKINVMSHIYAGRTVIPGMIKRGGGTFMITASAAGLLTHVNSAPYSVTKHAAVGLAEHLSITYSDQGIKIFILCPQSVHTAMAGEGDVGAVDGLMEPSALAEAVIAGLKEEKFLILPHPQVKTYMQRKVSDYDRWLQGMRRFKARFNEGTAFKIDT